MLLEGKNSDISMHIKHIDYSVCVICALELKKLKKRTSSKAGVKQQRRTQHNITHRTHSLCITGSNESIKHASLIYLLEDGFVHQTKKSANILKVKL
jgi:hypothetical protein